MEAGLTIDNSKLQAPLNLLLRNDVSWCLLNWGKGKWWQKGVLDSACLYLLDVLVSGTVLALKRKRSFFQCGSVKSVGVLAER